MTGTVFWISYAALWFLTLALVISTVLAYRFMAEAFVRGPRGRREQGPEVGTKMTALVAHDLRGREVYLGNGASARLQVVSFLAAGCKPCETLIPELRDFSERYHAEVDAVAICDGKEDRVMEMAEALGSRVLVVRDASGDWRQTLRILSVPFALVVSASGVVQAKGKVRTRIALESLIGENVGSLESLIDKRGVFQ